MSKLPKALVAATLALSTAGCATDGLSGVTDGARKAVTQLAPSLRTIGSALVQDTVTALVAETDGEAAGYAAMEPGSAQAYRVQLEGYVPPPGMVGITATGESPRGDAPRPEAEGPLVGGQGPVAGMERPPAFVGKIGFLPPPPMKPGTQIKRGKPGDPAQVAKLKQLAEQRVGKLKGKVDAKRQAIRNAKRDVIPGEDGTVAVVATFEQANKGGTHSTKTEQIFKGTSEADVKPENLLSSQVESTRMLKNGVSVKSIRTVAVNEDGSKDISFSQTITRKDGKEKSIVWERTVQPDGSSSGTGTLTRFDGSKVNIERSVGADGVVKATVTDTRQKVKAEVAVDEAADKVEAEISSTDAPAEKEAVPVADPEAAEPAVE